MSSTRLKSGTHAQLPPRPAVLRSDHGSSPAASDCSGNFSRSTANCKESFRPTTGCTQIICPPKIFGSLFRTFTSRSNSLPLAFRGLVAQWIRHLTTNQGIPGSSPGKIAFSYAEIVAGNRQQWAIGHYLVTYLPCGLVGKASDFEAEGCGLTYW